MVDESLEVGQFLGRRPTEAAHGWSAGRDNTRRPLGELLVESNMVAMASPSKLSFHRRHYGKLGSRES